MYKPQRIYIPMTRTEQIAGWIYLPFYLVIISALLGLFTELLGYDVTDEATLTWVNLIYGAINFIAIVAIFHHFLTDSLEPVLHYPLQVLGCAILGFGLYFAGTSLVSSLTLLVDPGLQNVNNQAIMGLADQNLRVMVVFSVLLAPLPEEVLFRGLIFGRLYTRSRPLGYIVSTVLFSAIHVVGYIGSYSALTLLMCFLQYIPASLVLAWIYTRTSTIWTCVLTHTMVNAAAMFAMRLAEQVMY